MSEPIDYRKDLIKAMVDRVQLNSDERLTFHDALLLEILRELKTIASFLTFIVVIIVIAVVINIFGPLIR